ncbi:CcdB family protein [Variovorax atrisoli]|uniref:CcdB family protein n=1 Tax=Variovorax TaxID=34072 RepID=UPI003392878E
MAQFDVYANPSKTQRGEIPWVVDIQSEILNELPTRLVMPSALRANMPAAMPQSLCTTIHRLGRSDPGGFTASGRTHSCPGSGACPGQPSISGQRFRGYARPGDQLNLSRASSTSRSTGGVAA